MITTLVVVALTLLVGAWILGIANRLDRLHIRTDAAWAALDAALARRAVVTRALLDESLRQVADIAELAQRPDREAAENALSGLLGALDRRTLPPALAAELADAEQRVVLARRVHNDAVRDTLTQRRRRIVRWLKLSGTARQPAYFEIAEPVEHAEAMVLTPRPAARLILTDAKHRVLLFQGHDPARPQELFWFTVGGGIEQGEELRAAALREAFEETGLELSDDQLTGPVWRRRAVFSFGGETFDAEEWFFHAKVDRHIVDTSGFNDVELATVKQYRWWTLEELTTTEDTIYPVQLAEYIKPLLDKVWDGRTRVIR